MAEPEDTGGGSRVAEYSGPTRTVRKDSATEGRGAIVAALELDDEATDMVPTPPPGSLRRTLPRAATPHPRNMVPLGAGDPVGDFEIQSQIGEGAMGTVYLAVQPLIGKQVAIKVLKPELCANQASVDRFIQEAQAVNKIGHPNIVDVFSLGELPDGRAYFVMEWLRGEDLKARLAKGPLTVEETCDVLIAIARALEAAHAKGIVHRDLKPDNVFLQQIDNGPMLVKLLDFGIAKLMREKQTMEKTQTGNMLGTPRYISPEQARGVDVTHRSDIYSLGVMAYELLAGRAPFTGETGMDLVVKHLNETPPPISQFAKIPKPLEQCVMAMLAKDPATRPSLETVRRVLVSPTERMTMALPRVRKRSRGWLVAGVLVVAAAGGLIAWRFMDTGGEVAAVPAITMPAPERVVEPPPAVRGGIAITIRNAKDAQILVDGEDWGRNTASKMVDVGEHEITAKVAGKPPISQKVIVEAEGIKQVTLAFPAPVAISRPVRQPIRRPVVPKPPPPKSDLLKPKGIK